MFSKLAFFFIFSLSIHSQNIEESFKLAQENRKELESVLQHYQELGDQQKYNAAYFLIENMKIHSSTYYIWINKDGYDINFNETDYKDLEKAKKAFEEINDSIKINPKRIEVSDVKKISKDFLIENIDLAFEEWQENSWSNIYDFETFCEYILPYRSLIEPIENWRSEYNLLYEGVKTDLIDDTDPVEVCTKIINKIKHFDFVMERFDPSPLLGPMELLFWREGNCPDLANVSLFASRSLGVAVTFDFTPYFAASSNKHFWNTVINKDGEHIPFNGNQVLPYVYNANYRRMGKIFRNTFSAQRDNLPFFIAENQIPDDFLKARNLIDVTKEYVDISNIQYTFNNQVELAIGYLNVFNTGKWRVVHWGHIKNKTIVFNDMGLDIIYLPSLYINNQMIYEPFPILLDKTGKERVLKPEFGNSFTATLSRKNEKVNEYEDNNPFEIGNGKIITLYVWNGKWQVVEKQKSKNYEITFNKIPKNGLFLMATENVNSFERIFILDDKTYEINWY